MELGVTFAEYERTVGPKNKLFHESAEMVYLSRDGILPIDDDDEGADLSSAGPSTGPSVGMGDGTSRKLKNQRPRR